MLCLIGWRRCKGCAGLVSYSYYCEESNKYSLRVQDLLLVGNARPALDWQPVLYTVKELQSGSGYNTFKVRFQSWHFVKDLKADWVHGLPPCCPLLPFPVIFLFARSPHTCNLPGLPPCCPPLSFPCNLSTSLTALPLPFSYDYVFVI